jgi:hypothetical protein
MEAPRKLLWSLLGARAAVAVAHAWRPVTSPHVWRQVDTLAVAFRYWQRWSLGPTEGWRALLPAVLNGGDAIGYVPMELPLMNLLAAPAFALGIDRGRSLAHLVSLAALLLAVALNCRIWRDRRIAGVDAATWLPLIPCFSVAAAFFAKFMPDLLATLLVLAGVGSVWKDERGSSPWRAALAASLTAAGMLIKPTACGVLPLLLLSGERPAALVRRAVPLGIGAAVAFLYYTRGIAFLRTFQDVIPHFAVEPRPPLQALGEFLAEPLTLADLGNYHAFVPWAPVLVLAGCLWQRWRPDRDTAAIVACLAIQSAGLAALSGRHVYIHVYYFMALAPTLALLALRVTAAWTSRAWTAAFWLLVIGRLVEISVSDLGGYRDDGNAALYAECAAMRQRTPDFGWGQDLPFRSSREDYPLLGLCFGERQESATAPRAFYYVKDGPPPGCRIRDAGTRVGLASC